MTTILPQFCKKYQQSQDVTILKVAHNLVLSNYILSIYFMDPYFPNTSKRKTDLDEHVCVEERLVSRGAWCARHCAQRGLTNSLSGLAAGPRSVKGKDYLTLTLFLKQIGTCEPRNRDPIYYEIGTQKGPWSAKIGTQSVKKVPMETQSLK